MTEKISHNKTVVVKGLNGAPDELRDIAEELEAKAAPASTQDEPFGYFRVDALGWTDCAATDEGAIALYERPAAPAVPNVLKRGYGRLIQAAADLALQQFMPGDIVDDYPSKTISAAKVAKMMTQPRDRLRLLSIEVSEGAKQMLAAAPAAPSQEPAAWVPHLVDRADGVKGHYAIGRWNPRGFREVWNLHTHRWAAYSDDVMSLEEADSLLRQITIPTIAAAPSQEPAVPQGPVCAALGDIVSMWDQHVPSEYVTPLHMQAKRALAGQQPVSPDMHGWCAYVGGMVAHWIKSEPYALTRIGEERFEAAIAGIIERRLWAMPKSAAAPAAPSQPVTLTDEEIKRNWSGGACPPWGIKFARAIIAALREKEQAK